MAKKCRYCGIVQSSGEAEPMPPVHRLDKLRPVLGILADCAQAFDDISENPPFTAQEFVTWLQMEIRGVPDDRRYHGNHPVLRAHDVGVLRAVAPHR